MNATRCIAALILLSTARTAAAIEDQSILWVYWITPQPGMEQNFVEGLKAHQQWRRNNGETWRWIVWRIASGERSGTFAVGTFNHRWSDFANPPVDPAAASANWQTVVAPYVGSLELHHYSYQKALNTLRDDQPPRSFSVTEEFEIVPGREADFLAAAAQIREAITATGLAYHYEWYRLETGGAQPLYARVRLLWDWSDLKTGDAAVEAAVRDTFGARRGAAILERFHGAIQSERNRFAELRPELFLIPDG